jgi:1,4-alpha-glucan branching enzyme
MKRTAVSAVILATLACLFAVARAGMAQPATPAMVSPEVHLDHTVTFRLRAPNAQRVTVNGDFWGRKSFPMTNDATFSNGVWSVTTPPLEPDIYAYTFDTDKGIKHEWVTTPDYAHEWTLWRRYLHDVLPKLFAD